MPIFDRTIVCCLVTAVLIVVICFSFGTRLANVVVVAKNGSDWLGTGSHAPPFLTINRALTVASSRGVPGIVVWIMPGIYNENIVIPDNIIVRGHNNSSVIISQVDYNGYVVTMGAGDR